MKREMENSKTCLARRHDGSPCGRTLYDDRHCIFHSEDIEGKKEEFDTAFWKEFERQDKEDEIFDFSWFVFPGDISFDEMEIKKNIYFEWTRFFGEANFDLVKFHGTTDFNLARFTGNANFAGNSFFERANFYKVEFNGVTNFNISEFSKDCVFAYAKFFKQVGFNQAEFFGRANFDFAGFLGKVDFDRVKFSLQSDFNETQFLGEAYFNEANFLSETDFSNVEFSKEIDFYKAKFYGEAKFYDTSFLKTVDFKDVIFLEKTSFSNSLFSELVDFMDTKFLKEAIFRETIFLKRVDFSDTTFTKNVNFIGTKFSGEVIFSNTKFLEGAELTFCHFNDVKGLLEDKDLIFFKKTKYKLEDMKFFLGDKSAAQYPVINRKAKDAWFLEDYKKQHPNIYRVWKISSDCGQKLSWWAGWSLGIALVFAFIFMLLGSGAFEARHYTWFSYFYYSIVTFTTLGFGDITPIKWYSEIAVTLEVILGYIMLGGLISIFATKLARRS